MYPETTTYATKMPHKNNKGMRYVNGFNQSNINSIARYEFGERFLTSYKDLKNRTFVVILKPLPVETMWKINKFQQYFGVRIKLLDDENASYEQD